MIGKLIAALVAVNVLFATYVLVTDYGTIDFSIPWKQVVGMAIFLAVVVLTRVQRARARG